jgi:WD40 repeat protein
MGVVYKARQVSLNRLVALKMILAGGHAGAEERRRFLAEAEALAAIRHPGIIEVHDFGTHEGLPFFALEYCEGGSLADRLSGTPLPPREAAGIVAQLGRAVQAAHEQGIVHRDLKPANVLLGAGGALKVTDFGLAKRSQPGGGLTQTGAVMGTPSYMAPEQAAGAKDVGPAADVYALGAILYECLTGRPPFKAATSFDTLTQVMSEDPVPPRRLNAGVPADLEAVVLKCLEKGLPRRYGTAAELADDLRRFLDGEPVRARAVSQAERFWRWGRRHPARVGAAVFGLFAALASVGLLLGALFAVEKDRAARALQGEKEKTEAALAEAEKQRGLAEAYSAKADRLSALLLFQDGAALCEGGDAGRGVLRMARGLATCPASAPDLARAIRTGLSSNALRLHTLEAVFGFPSAQVLVAFSPDGKALLFGGGKLTRRVDVATGRPRGPDQASDRPVSGGGFSPDGKLFVTSTMGGTVRVADTATGDDVGPPILVKATVKSVTFSPDGKSLLVAAQFGETKESMLRSYDVATRQLVGPTFDCKDNVYVATYSRDGRYIATAAIEKNATVWDAATGRRVGEPLSHPGVVFAATFSPDGKTLVTGCLDGGVRFWDVGLGKQVPPTLRHKGPVRSAVFSRDGRLVLTSSEDGTARLWDVESGRPIGQKLSHPSELRHAQFSPDERHIVTAGFEGTARLWRVAREESLARVLEHPGAVAELALSPDGKQVLTGCQESKQRPGESRLWDLATGALCGPPMSQQGQVMAVAFSPDGKLILTGGNDRHARLWSAADCSPVGKPWDYGRIVAAVAFSPDGARAAIGGRGSEVQLRKLPGGEIVGRWQAYERKGLWAWSLAFTPDGRTLATGGGMAGRLWSLPGAHRIGQEMRHESEARTVLLSPDGQTALTCSHDKTARLWSVRDGQPLSPPLLHKGEVRGGVSPRRQGRGDRVGRRHGPAVGGPRGAGAAAPSASRRLGAVGGLQPRRQDAGDRLRRRHGPAVGRRRRRRAGRRLAAPWPREPRRLQPRRQDGRHRQQRRHRPPVGPAAAHRGPAAPRDPVGPGPDGDGAGRRGHGPGPARRRLGGAPPTAQGIRLASGDEPLRHPSLSPPAWPVPPQGAGPHRPHGRGVLQGLQPDGRLRRPGPLSRRGLAREIDDRGSRGARPSRGLYSTRLSLTR